MAQIKPTRSEINEQTPEGVVNIIQESRTEISGSLPQSPAEKPKKDYLVPAIAFIGLFFAFFILITIQQLTKTAVHPEDTVKPQPNVPIGTMDQPKTEPTLEEQIKIDGQKETTEVTTELMDEIDSVGNIDVDSLVKTSDLDDLAE